MKIYDPYFEYQFENAYTDDYEFIAPAKFNNDLIFKLTAKNSKDEDVVVEYSVEDFYKAQSKLSGLEVVIEQLRLDYAYSLKDKFLTDDQISDFEEELKKFRPSLEVEDAEEAINGQDLVDMVDIMMKTMKKTRTEEE